MTFVHRSCVVLALVSSGSVIAQLPDGLYAEIQTNKGLIVARLEPDRTPMTVANFVGLAEGTIDNEAFAPGRPYYDGSVFHRVVPGHVIQAGRPAPGSSEARAPGYTFPNEIHADLSHDHAGALGMANGGPHTNSAQFYITLGDRSYLDGDYIVFGNVVAGMDVVNSVVQDDVIESVRIVRVGDAAAAFLPDTASLRTQVAAAEARIENDGTDRRVLELQYIDDNFGSTFRTPSGIRYQVRRPGAGGSLQERDAVDVRYVGTALKYRGHILGYNGAVFEEVEFGSNADGTPGFVDAPAVFSYEIGATSVTVGFDEIVAGMRRGEQRLVVVPAHLAYGRRGFYGPDRPGESRFVVSPNTVLVYGIEVLTR